MRACGICTSILCRRQSSFLKPYLPTNFERWRETYLEDMRRLPVTAPEVHRAFMMGQFVVKRAISEFNAVGLDLALEQSIQRPKKTPGGVIGKTQ